MKKCKTVCLFVIISVLVLQLISCGSNSGQCDDDNIVPGGDTGGEVGGETEETPKNELVFTNEYDLDELRNYFESGHQNEAEYGLSKEKAKITYDVANQRFPVEIERTYKDLGRTYERPAYTVYKVRQGGYYYVWWKHTADFPNDDTDYHVYFSAYLASDRSVDTFSSLILGQSSLADVKKIDPYTQVYLDPFSTIDDQPLFSHSYINERIRVSICFTYIGNDATRYDNYIVKTIRFAPINGYNSEVLYTYILPGDLPGKTANNDSSTGGDYTNKDLTDDIPKNDLIFTNEYDLNELRTYFEAGHQNEPIDEAKPKITYDEVNQRFPIEIERTYAEIGGTSDKVAYTMYKVSQGGYYYVWWRSSTASPTYEKDFYVYFSAYLVSDRSLDMFNSIRIGESTLSDVKAVDPYAYIAKELSSHMPANIYINEKIALVIGCSYSDDSVIWIELRERTAPGTGNLYSYILPGDLP